MIREIQPGTGVSPPETTSRRAANAPSGAAFAEMLTSALRRGGDIRFSAHAQQRMAQRGIMLSEEQLGQIRGAVDLAAAKGCRESLLLIDRTALVVNIPNRTVITVLSAEEAAGNVFTNIDSAVVLPDVPETPQPEKSFGPDPAWGGPQAAERLTRPNL